MGRFPATLNSVVLLTALGIPGCSAVQSVPSVVKIAPSSNARGAAASFVPLEHQPPEIMLIAFLMTDGSVVTQGEYGSDWFRYVPDGHGDYAKGKWSKIASLPSGYAPEAFASQVLADGRLVISGGEYNVPSYGYPLQLVNLGAVYDPQANQWTPLGHPKRWGYIGDSPSTLLPHGGMLLGQKLTERDALLDPKTLTWKSVSDAGKADFNAEEGWTLLPDRKSVV